MARNLRRSNAQDKTTTTMRESQQIAAAAASRTSCFLQFGVCWAISLNRIIPIPIPLPVMRVFIHLFDDKF